MIHHVRRWVVATCVLLILLLAMLLSAGRWALQVLPEYRAELAEMLSEEPHYRVEFGRVAGGWERFSPRLEFESVRVRLADEQRIDIGRMVIHLDTVKSLWFGEPVFHRVLLDQLDLSLYRSREHGWDLAGKLSMERPQQPQDDGPGNLLPLVQSLLLHQELELRNALIQVQFEGHDPLPPQLINIVLQNQGEQHALIGRWVLGLEQAVELRAVTMGLPGEPGFDADFYLSSPDLAQNFWNQLLGDYTNGLQQYRLGGELWGRWDAKGQHQLQGELRLPWLELEHQDGRLHVRDLQLDLDLRFEGLDHAQLALTHLTGSLDGIELPLTRLSGRKQGQQWQLSGDRLQLEPLWQWFNGSTLVPDAVKQRLAGLNPTGELHNWRFNLHSNSAKSASSARASITPPAPAVESVDSAVDFGFVADLVEVGVSAWQGAPAMSGVNGLLQLDQHGGRVDFSSTGFGLEFPALFSQGWQFEQASGVVLWQLEPQRVQVRSQHLQLVGEQVRANGRFSLDLPSLSNSERDGRLVLMIGMEQANAALTPLFVPDKVVSEPLFNWLQRSIIGGQLNQGGLMMDLPLAVKSSREQHGTLQMFFDAEQARVEYQPDWPAIEQADPYVLIKGTEVLVEVGQGRLLDSQLARTQVYLPPQSSVLQVDGTLQGPAADIRTTLIDSPIGRVVGDAMSPWQLQGHADSTLRLGVDLKQPEQTRIRVQSTLSDGVLEQPALGLRFEQLQGSLEYHERDGLSAEAIQGRLFEQPLQARIASRPDGEGFSTLIEGSGTLEMARLNQWLKQPLLGHLQGKTHYQAKLEICGSRPNCSGLRIDSNLLGVDVELPPPFRKKKLQRRPLGVDISLTQQPWLRLRYDRQLDLLIPLRDRLAGELVLGRNQPEPQRRQEGFWVRGQLGDIELEPWQQFIEQSFFNPQVSANVEADNGTPEAELTGSPLRQVDLRVERLRTGTQQFEQLHGVLQPQNEGWQLQLSSPLGHGRVGLSQDSGAPLQVHLTELKLPREEPSSHGSRAGEPFDPASDPLLSVDPATLLAAKVKIDALHYGDRSLGQWQFSLQPYEQGVRIEGLEAKMEALGLVADIDWRLDDGIHSTRIDLAFSTGDLGRVMQAWGSTPGLQTESAKLSGQFQWDGSPLAFNWQTLDGETELLATNGRVLDTGSGAEAVKIFSLFNSTTIWRRLRLDFSDLAQQGVSFDQIRGHYRISDGVATSIEPLAVEGPTFDLTMQGQLDLHNETLKQQMQVTLPITENLPIAAALLASPQVAGAVFLVEKLIGKKLSKFTSVRYNIDGPWNDPNMQLQAPAGQNRKPLRDER